MRAGSTQGASDAKAEAEKRSAAAIDRIAAAMAVLDRQIEAVEAKFETEAVEVAVAVARKLAPALISQEPFAEIAALAIGCFRNLVKCPHVVVRVNDALHESAREKLDEIVRRCGPDTRLVVLARAGDRARRLPHRMGRRRHQSRLGRHRRRDRRGGDALHQCTAKRRGRQRRAHAERQVEVTDERQRRQSAASRPEANGMPPLDPAAMAPQSSDAAEPQRRRSRSGVRRPGEGLRRARTRAHGRRRSCSSSAPARCSNSTARSARRSTSTSTTAWSRAARWCWSRTSSA